MSQDQKVTIDGTEYPLDSLSDEAKTQLQNVKVTEQEVARLKMQLAIAETARNAYARALGDALPK